MGLDGCSGHNDAGKVDILDRIGVYLLILFLYEARRVNSSNNNCNREISGQKEGFFFSWGNSRKLLKHHSVSR